MKKCGSCGLKQARYDISWIEDACRCFAVQKLFVKYFTPVFRESATAVLHSPVSSRDPPRLQKSARYLLKSSGFFIAGISKGLLPRDVITCYNFCI